MSIAPETISTNKQLEAKPDFQRVSNIAPPAVGMTANVNATAGNLNGSYFYQVSFVNHLGETGNGEAPVSANPVNQQVDLASIPIGPSGTLSRKIYRGKNTGYDLNLVATIPNNTATTHTDNVADATANAAALMPRVNTTGGIIHYLNGARALVVDTLLTAMGVDCFPINKGINNVGMGNKAGLNNTKGYWCLFLGDESGRDNTIGWENVRLGFRNGLKCTEGFYNTSGGVGADQENLLGAERTSFGYVACQKGTASGDTGFGAYVLVNAVGGGRCAGLGVRAGALLNDGVTPLTDPVASLYLGNDTYSGQNDADHEIVLGTDARGGGSFTATIGTSSQLQATIYGRTVIQERAWDPVNTLVRLQPISSNLARGKGIRIQILAQPTDQNTLFDAGAIYGVWDGSTYNTERMTFQTPVDGTMTDTLSMKYGRVGCRENTPDYTLDVNGPIGWKPGSSVNPVDINHIVAELTNDTTLTFKAKGSDGVVRSNVLTLTP